MSQEMASKIQCPSKYKRRKKVPLLLVILPCGVKDDKYIHLSSMHMKNVKK